MVVFAVMMKSWNFDDCGGSSVSLVGVYSNKSIAIVRAERRVRGWCQHVQWNSDQTEGKASITTDLFIEEVEVDHDDMGE